jgi:predicted helicase
MLYSKVEDILSQPDSTKPPTTSKELAARMAHIAHTMRDMTIITSQQNALPDTLHKLYNAFKQTLIPDLEVVAFADMFAQTLACGLFAARYNHTSTEAFRRQHATHKIPNTNPLLAELFEITLGQEMDDGPFMSLIDDLARLLAQTDMNAIHADFARRHEDPLIHFYETFLTAYDPELRELYGVYYTPEPVVVYLVHSVDYLLRAHFDCPDGLATTGLTSRIDGEDEKKSSRVLVLDPACGTGTFLHAIINYIRTQYKKTGTADMWPNYVREHLLPRISGFELLTAPYMMAHLKLGMQLAGLDLPVAERTSWSYNFKNKESLDLYLTNSLEETMQRADTLFAPITEKSDAAAKISKAHPVLVVIGNPPYCGHSANKGQWIKDLLHGIDTRSGLQTGNYFAVDGKALDERNPKWLNDDYVKFIRFAQWRIEQMGAGILAFITNHGYLDNPTFRGMRQSLMQSFDEIYVLDLHGNSKKQDCAPDGSKDENIFGIQQGVALGIFVRKHRNTPDTRLATVYHAHLWGPREVYREVYEEASSNQQFASGKYQWLAHNNVRTTEWTALAPERPFYLFMPQDTNLRAEYARGEKITDIMPVNVMGFQTHRDHFAVDFEHDTLFQRIKELREKQLSNQDYATKHNLIDTSTWRVATARQKIRHAKNWQAHFIQCLYRPFDVRYCYFNAAIIDRPRKELLEHVAGKENLCIGLGRQGSAVNDPAWSLISVARVPIDANIFRRGGITIFPLYLYQKNVGAPDMHTEHALHALRQNFTPDFLAKIARKVEMKLLPQHKGDLQQTFGPEDIFNYMYAIFHSPTYRQRYADFLKTDFPRLPLTSNRELFRELCSIGNRLVKLHLLEEIGSALPVYPREGNNIVDTIRYTEACQGCEQGRIWINEKQYFEDITTEIWQFRIGGYRVCQKWLKDRKGRVLSFADIEHYKRLVANLGETLLLMRGVDEVIDERGGWPVV